MFSFPQQQQQNIRHANKQEHMAHSQEKINKFETIPESTQILELLEK